MKISIIIPTYNCGQYIKKAIDSVIEKQSYKNKEVIVIDGGSIDSTIEILKSYGEKIKWISEKDNGQSDAINKGFRMANGEIVTWLNADDYYQPEIFNPILEEFIRHEDVVLVYGKCRCISEYDSTVAIPPDKITLKQLINCGNFIYQPASFYRLDSVRKVGFLDDTLNYMMEYDFFIKLLKLGKFSYIDEVLANFTIREDQKSNKKNLNKIDDELLNISIRHGGHYLSKIHLRKIYNKIVKI